MGYNIDIEQSICNLVNHDIYLSLDQKYHHLSLSGYECMLLHLISASRDCLKKGLLNPNALIIGYENEILYNGRFSIKEENKRTTTVSQNCNFVLELIADHKYPKKLYYCIQEKANPEKVYFHWLNVSKTMESYDFEDISVVINLIVQQHKLTAQYETINIALVKHFINFSTGDWFIKKS